MPEKKVTVIGCGLIGGSICLAIRRRRPKWEIAALDVPERVPGMVEAGVADSYGSLTDAAEHLPESDLVIVATPVDVIPESLERAAPHLKKGAVVTDVGSVKTPIMERAREIVPQGVAFIGGHPIAGAEVSGVQAADPLLFKERVFVLCPYSDTPADALLFLIDVVEDLLAWPVTIEPEEHDRILGMVSHVPQLLSVALLDAAMEDDATHGMLDLIAGKGFLDMTRLAASDFDLWRGILESNRPAIRAALDRVEQSLTKIRAGLEEDHLAPTWERVSRRRRRMRIDKLPRMRVPDWRRLIDAYDEEILKSLALRMQVATRIGTLKRDREAPVGDPDRERRMLAKRHEWARSLGLPDKLVEELFQTIIRFATREQSRIHSERSPAERS